MDIRTISVALRFNSSFAPLGFAPLGFTQFDQLQNYEKHVNVRVWPEAVCGSRCAHADRLVVGSINLSTRVAIAVDDALRMHGYPRLIHGHTHRPARHTHHVDGHTCERWVLADWYAKASSAERQDSFNENAHSGSPA